MKSILLTLGAFALTLYLLACSETSTTEEQGIKVTLALSYKSTISAMAGHPEDPGFIKALDGASKSAASPENLIQSFFTIYSAVQPGKAITTFFSGPEAASEAALKSFLLEGMLQKTRAMETALKKRIKIICNIDPAKVTITRNNNELLIEVPGITDMEALNPVFTNREGIQVWALADATEILPLMVQTDERYREQQAQQQKQQQQQQQPKKPDAEKSLQDFTSQGSTGPRSGLFQSLQPMVDMQSGQIRPGAILAYADEQDTAGINAILNDNTWRTLLPASIRFMWGSFPGPHNKPIAALYAVTRTALVDGSDIASAENTSENGRTAILVRLNAKGKMRFEQATTENINRAIGIELDNYIYSAPIVQTKISLGIFSIDGISEAAEQQVKIINAGTLPLPFRIKAISQSRHKS